MKESYYFPHDYNARNDEKIIKLWKNKDAAGYGIYWAIVEMLYEAGGVMRLDCDCIAFALHTQCDLVKSVLHDFGLFEINGTQFTSKRVQENLETRNTKSVNARKSAYKRWGECERNANAMPTQCEGNAIKERKGKESKRKEKKTTLASIEKTTFDFSTSKFVNLNGKIEKYKEKYPAVNVETEILKMEAWLMSNPRNRKSNYDRFINNWLSKAQDKAKSIPVKETLEQQAVRLRKEMGEIL